MAQMTEPFYRFILSQRNPNTKDEISEFAYNVEKDGMFPKTSKDYNEISDYLEMNGHYLPSMTVFDDAWELYKNEKHL